MSYNALPTVVIWKNILKYLESEEKECYHKPKVYFFLFQASMPSICFFLKSFQKFMLLNPTKIKSRSLTWWQKQHTTFLDSCKNRRYYYILQPYRRYHPPNFFVFYNGTERPEDRWEDLLLDAYENLTETPNLELKVLTLNINEGHNEELMEQCLILKEYAQYVAKVRNYTKEMKLDVAVERAVNECIHEGILVEFLRKNRAEVIAMSIFEYDKEEEEKKLRKAEFESGVEAGFKTGIETGIKSMLDLGKYSMEEIAEVFHVSVDKVKAVRNMLI
ncbi:hypothetical protein [Blautia sp. OM07-19]|uniref:hypothetical protein n=1 Tax=Blautia sp. OM07-19 TaxID=2292985 RepID=UPI002E8E1B38|nr:hypothetical protein [Blautia sp. OM07-19]